MAFNVRKTIGARETAAFDMTGIELPVRSRIRQGRWSADLPNAARLNKSFRRSPSGREINTPISPR
jgi:hypothetical protein